MKQKKGWIVAADVLAIVLFLATALACFRPTAPSADRTEFAFDAGALPDETPQYPVSYGGKTYYVSADGGSEETGADGSIEHPFGIERIRWFTRDKPESAEPFFKPGDRILLKRGDVFKTNLELNYCRGTPDDPITIASYGDAAERPVIELCDRGYGGSYQSNENTGSIAGVILNRCSDIVVRDLEIAIKWTSRRTSLASSAGGILAEYDRAGSNKYQNVYIVNNVIHSECLDSDGPYDANTFGIRLNSYELTYDASPNDFVLRGAYITNNEVYDLGRSGIVVHGWIQDGSMPQMKFTLFSDVHLDDNVVHDVGTIGMYAGAATGCTMDRNLIYNTGMYVCDTENGEDPQEGEGGLMSMCLKDGEIKNNVTYNNYRQGILNDGIGIDIDWNSMNIVVQYNDVSRCDGSGIGTMANAGCKILNNRVADNRVMTNQPGQISVCDFVPWGDAGATARDYIAKNSADLLTVRNLEIAENLLIGAAENGTGVNPSFPNKGMFYARRGNGVGNWIGNSFHDNRLVHTGESGNFFFDLIVNESGNFSDTVDWDKFYGNRYFAKDLSTFYCIDETAYKRDAAATLVPVCSEFASWAKRDLGATFEQYDPNQKPGKPSGARVTFENGTLHLQWNKSSGDVWHYNVFLVADGKEPDYRDLLGQTKTTSFDYVPAVKGTFCIAIRPENNMGTAGEALTLKIALQ